MAGPGVDERAFNTLRQIRAENEGLTLEAFKQILRAQYFSLVLDPAGALAAIPKMLPAGSAERDAHARGHPPDGPGGRRGHRGAGRAAGADRAPVRGLAVVAQGPASSAQGRAARRAGRAEPPPRAAH